MKKNIPNQRIETLYKLAVDTAKSDPTHSQRYIGLMRRIAQRTRTKIPSYIRHGICKKCDMPLIPGFNSQTRIGKNREPHITTTCLNCGNIMRRPLRRKTP